MNLNDVELFAITPTQLIQLILGTNGSGKSSLMGVLTPLPSDGADFYKDGGEEKEFSHNGSHYRVVSEFPTKAGKHWFIKDGVVLNDGGTSAVQRELVFQEFRITPEIRDLILGQERFTQMGPSRRREWLTVLSDSNYDYAIGLFNRMKEKLRDTKGSLKRFREDLVTERNKLMTEAEQKRLREDIDALHREYDILLENRAPLDKPVGHYLTKQDEMLALLAETSERLLRQRLMLPFGRNPLRPGERNEWGEIERPYFESLSEIDEATDYLRLQVAQKEALVNKAMADHKKHEEAMELLRKTGAEGMEQLQNKMMTARNRRDEFLSKRKLKLEGINGSVGLYSLDSTQESLVEIFTSIPINEERRYGQQQMLTLQEKVLALKGDKQELTAELARKNAAKQHMESHKASGETTCPKCSHVWHQGYDPERFAKVMELIGEIEVKIAKIDAEIRTNEEEIEINRTYGTYYRSFIQLTRSWQVLQPLWDYLLENEYVTKNPRFVLQVLETFRYDLECTIEADKADKEIEEIKAFIARAEESGDTSIGETQKHLDETEANIEEYTAYIVETKKTIGKYSYFRGQLEEMMKLADRVKELRRNAKEATDEAVEMLRRESIILCTRQVQTALARKEETLGYVDLQRGIIENLEGNIRQQEEELEVLEHMVREMSPTEGIIAEGLMGFIRVFTGQMNALIKKIWTYPLMIGACGQGGINGAELDYQFPLMVQTKEKVRKDVSKGSTAQKEIVDVVFRVVAMEYLGMSEWPLFLDEFAASFDEVHRNTAMQVIKNLMEQKPFTQLFMVSHYEASYGALTHAEVCVLCPANITIPPSLTYNKHVVIS